MKKNAEQSKKQGDAFGYIQEQFVTEYAKVEKDKKAISKESVLRRTIAYGFKLVAVLGAVAIASGLEKTVAQWVGIAVAVVVGLDAVFSNHERLLSVVEARNAYRRLLNQVAREHSRLLGPIIAKNEAGNSAEAKSEAIKLNADLLAKLHTEVEKIEESLAAADLGALRRVSVEQSKDKSK